MEINEINNEIKKSKKYRNIANEVINQKIVEYVKKNPNFKNYPKKLILKEIKSILHKIHGSFQIKDTGKRQLYLEELKKDSNNKEIIDKILETNTSTKERLNIYPQLYDEIFKITSKPSSILDLGCGLNPFSFYYMNLKQVIYYAYDINETDSKFINDFFKVRKIEGKSEIADLSDIQNIKKLENVDICFMFKLLDVLEKKGHKYSEEVIKIIIEKCNFLVVSFPTRSIGGRPMNFPQRGWIERMLTRVNLKYKKLVFVSEIFYVISK